MTNSQYNLVYISCCEDLLEREVEVNETRREKLSRWIANATTQEYGKHPGAEVSDSTARSRMYWAIRDRVTEMNQDEGFIFIPLILGAILSWIIKRILDRLFPA